MRWQTIASNVSIRTISPTATPLPKAYDCVAVYIAGRRTSLVVYGWWPQPPTKNLQEDSQWTPYSSGTVPLRGQGKRRLSRIQFWFKFPFLIIVLNLYRFVMKFRKVIWVCVILNRLTVEKSCHQPILTLISRNKHLVIWMVWILCNTVIPYNTAGVHR